MGNYVENLPSSLESQDAGTATRFFASIERSKVPE